MKVRDLKAAPYNPRKITENKLKMLAKSMAEFGDLSGIIRNRTTGNLIGGHQRLKCLQPDWGIEMTTEDRGYIVTPWGKWDYREVEWPEKKEIAANIAANQHGGEFDIPLLKDLLVEIDDGSLDIGLIGFEAEELENIFTYEKSVMNKNFNNGYGGQIDNAVPGGFEMKYPVTFILTQEEWGKWEEVKQKIGLQSDKAAFLKIMGGQKC